jgi:hypothetical protein
MSWEEGRIRRKISLTSCCGKKFLSVMLVALVEVRFQVLAAMSMKMSVLGCCAI